MARVGMLLCGCGRYDGTEISEAVLAVAALDRLSARVEFLAPSNATIEVVDHASGQLIEGHTRSALDESARIARGRITPLKEARASILDALVIPGGQGIVRTLMRGVGEAGRKREVDEETAALVRAMLDQGKPVGTISLAGSLVSTILGEPLDEDPFSTPPAEIRIDPKRPIVWTPGFLASDRTSEIAVGIDRMIAEVVKRASRGLTVLG